MNNKNIRFAITFTALASASALHAQTLPPVPVSPMPEVAFEYDAGGNMTKRTLAPEVKSLRLSTQGVYDRRGRLQTLVDPRSKSMLIQHDGQDRTTQITDPRGLVTQYPRNGLGDALQLLSPDTGTASMTRDEAGNMTSRTDSRGVLGTYTYDGLNRLTQLVYSQAGQTSEAFAWTYNQTGPGFAYGKGRLTSTTHPAGATQYAYDPQGRVLVDTQTVNAISGANPITITKTVVYTRNVNGDVDSILYPSGRKLSITYTGGVPSAMALAKDATSTPVGILSGLIFNPFAGPKRWDWQMTTGTQANNRIFDQAGRMVRFRLGAVVRDLTYDAAGRIVRYTHYDAATGAAVPAMDQLFGYDKNSRITSISLGTATWALTYDDNGNRTQIQTSGSPNDYTIATDSNRLQATSSPAATYAHDAAGNQTSNGVFSANFNLAGRMSSLSQSGQTWTYTYDAFGRRVRKSPVNERNPAAIFIYDLQNHLLGEYNSAGTPMREYVWLGDTPVAMFTPGAVGAEPNLFFIHTDQLNTPRAVVDPAGALRWTWFVEPFGAANPDSNPSGLGSLALPLRFPGQYADTESGLNDNGYRSYDSKTGRYTQSDPLGLQGGLNTYAYVAGNPVSLTDPEGLQFLDLTTLAGAKRKTTLAEAVSAGAWTRAVTGPAVIAGLIPSASGLLATGSVPLFCAPETIVVSRWGREGLEAGDWVMKGGVNRWNYARSFKWEKTPWNQAATYSTGSSYTVPSSAVTNPTGWETFKAVFGQRIYRP